MPPAARVSDLHACPASDGPKPHVGGAILPPCETTVLIGFLPAARITDKAECKGPPDAITQGSPTVKIGNLMAARVGDSCAHGGKIILGEFTVMIGDSGSGGGGGGGGGGGDDGDDSSPGPSAGTPQGQAMSEAHNISAPFCEQCSGGGPAVADSGSGGGGGGGGQSGGGGGGPPSGPVPFLPGGAGGSGEGGGGAGGGGGGQSGGGGGQSGGGGGGPPSGPVPFLPGGAGGSGED